MNNPKKQFREKIETCYAEYHRQWMQLPAAELIQKAEEIAAVQLMAKETPDQVSTEQAEYLLQFKNPLEVVSDSWLSENGSDVSVIDEELSHVLWRLIDTGDAEVIYETELPEPKKLYFGIFHIQENGNETRFASIGDHELLYTAEQLRRYVQHEESVSAFENLYPNRVEITEHEFDRYVMERLRDSGRVAGAFHIDFDKGEFSGVRLMDGWQSFQIKDICLAVSHAMRKEGADTEEQWDRLLDRLRGKEITPNSRYAFLEGERTLRPEEITFSGDIDQNDNLLNFYLETNFNVDEVFGTDVMTAENDDFLNIYADYDLEENCVCNTLTVLLECANGEQFPYRYRLNAEEQAVVTQKMDDYCIEQLGVSLSDCREQYLEEDAQPSQNLSM